MKSLNFDEVFQLVHQGRIAAASKIVNEAVSENVDLWFVVRKETSDRLRTSVNGHVASTVHFARVTGFNQDEIDQLLAEGELFRKERGM